MDTAAIQVTINQAPHHLPAGATVADAISCIGAKPPLAVAVNTQFVPQLRYPAQTLYEGDRVEIIAPVTGG